MSTTTEPTTLGRWPAPCNQDGCLAHLARKTDRCRCPRYKASAAGYHITSRNLDCPIHGPADVAAANGHGQAAPRRRRQGAPQTPLHLPPIEQWQRTADVSTVDGIVAAVRRGLALADVDDVCHREIEGTDDILSPCPQCGHLIAVHVGTDGCPVCVVEMLAAAHRAAARTQERKG